MELTEKTNRPRPSKHAVTYRLPEDVLALIERAVELAAVKGDRLTREDAITAAVRSFYGGGTQG